MKKFGIFLVLGIFLLFVAGNTNAWECEYGEAKAWVKLPGDAEWREAIVDGVTLKVHEPFQVKVWVKTKTECDVDIKLYDPGVTKVFEVVKGPSKNGDMIYNTDVSANWGNTYEWTVRPNDKFTEGWVPLNLVIFFMKSQDDYQKIDKTIIHAYISPQEWKGGNGAGNDNANGSNESSHHTPGFNFGMVAIAFIMLYIWRKRNG